MNKLTTSKRAEVIRCLVEGNSIGSTVRITGAAKNTVTKLLVDAGRACSAYQNGHLRNLPSRRIQLDEIWAFVHAKAKNVADRQGRRLRVPATSGRGPRSAPTRSSCRAGSSALVTASMRWRFVDDLRFAPGQPRPAHQRWPQARICRPSRKPSATMWTTRSSRSSTARPQRLRAPLQPGAVHRYEARARHRQSRSGARLDQLRRAPEPHDADVHAPVHPADQRVQ